MDLYRHDSTSATLISGNDDLLMQILLCITTKPLIKFKSVSKHWKSLISSPQFVYLHTLRHSKPCETSLLFGASPSDMIYSRPTSQGKIINYRVGFDEILQSCNGLFLVCQNSDRSKYIIYNPSTRICRNILLRSQENIIIKGLSLVFDPSKSPSYKVVCVRTTKVCTCCYQVEVFESETQSCRLCGNRFKPPQDVNFSRGIYCNDRIYWIRTRGRLFYFDLCKNSVGKTSRCPVPRSKMFSIKVWNDHLHCIAMDERTKKVLIFELQREDSRWILKYSNEFSRIEAAFPETNGGLFRLLCVIRGETDEESALVFHVPGRIVVWKLQDNSYVEVVDFRAEAFYEEGCLQFGDDDAYQFAHTLASV